MENTTTNVQRSVHALRHPCVQSWIITAIATALILVAIACGKTYGTMSDPNGSLLVSLAIIEHGTVQLDHYQRSVAQYPYQIQSKNGHYYYYFPLGTSLAAVPFVAIEKLLGSDIVRHQSRVQLEIAAIVLFASLLLLRKVALLYLPTVAASVAAATLLLGSAFISTGATALWSHDFAALFALLAIYLLLGQKNRRIGSHWSLLAVSLFAAYLCRPTLLLLAAVVIAVQFIFIDRKSALKTALLLGLLLLGFVAWSWLEFGQVLPDYYLPQRLDGETFWLAMYGNLASPARGLFVYSPFLLLPVLAAIPLAVKYPRYRPEIFLLIWPLLHLIVISKFPHWWAGYSFGARLMYDVLPGLFVVFVIFLRHARPISLQFTALAGLMAVVINLGQGIFNSYSALWNSDPNVDKYPELLFDWRYPQFADTEKRHIRRVNEFNALHANDKVKMNAADAASATPEQLMLISKLRAYKEKIDSVVQMKAALEKNQVQLDQQYWFDSDALAFIGWQQLALSRNSDAYYAEVAFMPDAQAIAATSLRIDLFSFRDQVVNVAVNAKNSARFVLPKGETTLTIDASSALRVSEINALQIEMPQAQLANDGEKTASSLTFKSMRLTR